ncbi:MAG: transcriptional repressor [Spirochaetales bacterium]|jgi:Fe2+ or Zn2+ uptake regulation protein|nr:transcriptional repressor [Spirochaetales bacterium]
MKERRQTIQKGLVWDALNESMNHPSAEQIYESIIEKHPTISRATVYRNLNSLVEDGKIQRVQVIGGPDHYDRMLHKHFHIQCVVCKSVHDIEVAKDLSVELENLDLKGYRLESYQVVFNGVCPDCQKE